MLATDHVQLGIGVEKTLAREDLLDWRTYLDLIVHYLVNRVKSY